MPDDACLLRNGPPAYYLAYDSRGTNMRWMYVAIIAVLALVTLIFALQNLQSVTISFLRLQLSAPLAVLILIIYVLGMATGGSAWALVRWAWQGSRES